MPFIEIPPDIFTRLYILDSPEGSLYFVNARKNISLYFKRRQLIIYKCYLTKFTWMIYIWWRFWLLEMIWSKFSNFLYFMWKCQPILSPRAGVQAYRCNYSQLTCFTVIWGLHPFFLSRIDKQTVPVGKILGWIIGGSKRPMVKESNNIWFKICNARKHQFSGKVTSKVIRGEKKAHFN